MSGKKSSNRPSIKQDPAVQERIAAAALEHPDFGIRRLARLLKNEGIRASEDEIRTNLQKQGLHPCKLRLMLLEKRHLNEGLQLTEEQKAALETFNPSLREPAPVPPIAAVLPETPAKPEEPEPAPESPVAVSPEPEKGAEPVPAALVSPVVLPAPALEPRVVKVPAAAPRAVVQIRPGLKRAGMNRWVFRAFKAALVCLVLYWGAGIAFKVRDILHQEPESSMASTAQPGPDIRQAQTKVRANPIETYRVIWERNLFRVSEPPKKQKVRESIDVDKIAVAENNIGLKLIGTVLANDPRMNYAIINVEATRRQGVYREKETVGGVLIKGILRNTVIIETDKGEIKRLSVDDAEIRNIGSAKAFAPIPVDFKADVDMLEDLASSSTTTYIPRDEVISSLSNVQEAIAASSLSPHFTRGKPDGFSVVGSGPQNIFARIGLQPGDLIRDVDGVQLKRPGDRLGFFKGLAKGGDFSLLIQRGGEVHLVRVVIN